jgi:hypothetical protein
VELYLFFSLRLYGEDRLDFYGQLFLESRSRRISYMKYVNGRRTGLVTFYIETAFYNGSLKERYKGG